MSEPLDAALRARIGVLAHAPMTYPDLSARENLRLYAKLHGVDPVARIEALVERFEIGRWGDRPARTYSRGQLQRLSLARALIHLPRLLLLQLLHRTSAPFMVLCTPMAKSAASLSRNARNTLLITTQNQ